MTGRVSAHPVLPDPDSVPEVSFTFNGKTYTGREGEPVAVALLAAGVRELRTSPVLQQPRGLYCGIGHCYECRLWLGESAEHADRVRGCQTALRAGDSYHSDRPDAAVTPTGKDTP